ncbi:right-handed parallel beta-helix repeat-containing protein [uncultured Gemmiger sp.]|uniref:right-handed parallel beta-helix repeat-containing protein n=1 Tax=uncultured Gemmiger sp. TaxID=1623490 RepID=UPI0027E03CBC|nr:right-handed parallel beta-helix repeat-containing protein [uncultured Gemmiger sp.]
MKDNRTSVKRSLLVSAIALTLTAALLIGSTFAWFTSTAQTSVSDIQAGKLEVQIVDANNTNTKLDTLSWQKSADAASNEAVLWEPNVTYKTQPFKVKSAGNLALKYKLALSSPTGDSVLLNNIEFSIVDENNNAVPIDTFEGHLTNTENFSGTFVLQGHMKEEAKNDCQGKTLNNINITVTATQDTVEYDSFGKEYDASAETDEFKQGVTVSGIAGVADSYDTIQDAYEAVKAMLVANSGLAEQPLSEEAFNAFFTDGGKITWTIYGNQKVTDNRMFSFGRAANRFGEGRHITEINIVGGNNSASLDLSEVNGTFALPYNWWNVEDSANTTLKCKNITFNGIKYMPSATYQCTLHPTTYEFDGCTFNGNLYSYQNFDVEMTIKNCTFNAPANTQYAFMAQGAGGKITLDNNVFNNYTRGINLERPNADFVVTNNTIRSTVSEPDRAAIQLTDGKSFVVTGNTVDVNAGNAFWFHNAATNADVTYTISNNDIKAPYIGYSGVTAFDVNAKITSSGNKFNSTDTTKCMKKGATVAEATNLTAIH